MLWLEVINVRIAGITEFNKALELCRQMYENMKSEEKIKVKVYRNTNYETDLGIHIFHDLSAAVPAKTVCGIRLSKLLARFGIVDHNVWRPLQLENEMTGLTSAENSNTLGTQTDLIRAEGE